MSLLELPSELLIKIIDLVIYSHRPAPKDGTPNANRAPILDYHLVQPVFQSARTILYELDQSCYTPNSYPLLTTCHTLRSITQEYLQGIQLKYSLDLLLMEGRQIWPTWTCIPHLDTQRQQPLDTLEATFHLGGPGPLCRSKFAGGDGGPALIAWMLLELLERNLLIGPFGPPADFDLEKATAPLSGIRNTKQLFFRKATHRSIAVHVLELNFTNTTSERSHNATNSTDKTSKDSDSEDSSSSSAAYEPYPSDEQRELDRLARLDNHTCRRCDSRLGIPGSRNSPSQAKPLYYIVTSHLGVILGLRYPEYSTTLFRHVGTLRYRVNGTMVKEFDLGEILARAPRTVSRDFPQSFHDWRVQTIAYRKQRGLSTVDEDAK